VKKINRIIVFVILIILVLVSISVIPRFHAKNTYFDDSIGVGIDPPDFDVGIIQPYPINGGDVIPTGEYEAALKVRFEVGDKPSQEDFRVLIESFEGLEWREVYSEIKGPYDLDPDAWIESFFDIYFDIEGEYRATFSILDPVTHENWTDDNPKNDVYQAVFSVRQNAGKDIFVDDNAEPGGDGSATAPFSTINDALDHATSGDCILVLEGIYQENIIVETPSITIKCDCDNPGLIRKIDGGGTGNVITISADWVTITGFTITNSGGNEEDAAIDITSNHNIISWNIIQENGATGVYLHDSAQLNYIHHNIIRNNDGAGIFIWEQSKENIIFHNDFIQNKWYNVKDKEGGNIWHHNYPYGGNYWDDYLGDDINSDGIGEEEYYIMGDYNPMGVDLYPWVKPHGWNNPPKIPIISGITSGKTEETYTYNLTIGDEHFEPGSEPFEEHVYCRVDWGDDKEEYYGPVHLSNLNDIAVSINHKWDVEGNYLIRAKLIDAYGIESDWATLEVSMPKTKSIYIFNSWIIRLINRFPTLGFLL
jgi:hypothetical protein